LARAALLHGSALTGLFDDRERGVLLLDEAGVLLEAEGDDWSLATSALARRAAALARGDLHQAQELLRRAADRFADVDNARVRRPRCATSPTSRSCAAATTMRSRSCARR